MIIVKPGALPSKRNVAVKNTSSGVKPLAAKTNVKKAAKIKTEEDEEEDDDDDELVINQQHMLINYFVNWIHF